MGNFLSGGLLALGIALLFAFLLQPVTVWVDGQAYPVRSLALTVGGVLRAAGLTVNAEDQVIPPTAAPLLNAASIRLERASLVHLWREDTNTLWTGWTTERLPANILAQAGIRMFPGDQLWLNGQSLPASLALPAGRYFIQFRPAQPLTLVSAGRRQTIYSAAPTIGQALWDAGVRLRPGDLLSIPADTLLNAPLDVELRRATPLVIQVEGKKIRTQSAAGTVGAALAEAGAALQGLDYSIPADDHPLPADGKIRVVRVREEILLQQTSISFTEESIEDPNLELDQREIIQTGEYGLKVSRQRVRYEDNEETARETEAEWTAVEPKPLKVTYGTKIVPHKENTPDGTIEYYRAVSVYATSYSPCKQGYAECSDRTASGTPLTKGIVAVTSAWYAQLKGSRVYIPGYGFGTILDSGGGIPGQKWIDLGYSDADYVNWHQTVTLYFLTPAPASVPIFLP